MAELIQQILALPRGEKLQLIALLAVDLQKGEKEPEAPIPAWQIEVAKKSLTEVQSGATQVLDHDTFWAAIDAKVEALEQQGKK